jgi:hypothetical protein
MSATKGKLNCVKGTSTLVRPKFAPGMLLQHDDLEQMSAYTRELSRLLFRSFFGCGVVCGLEVTPVQVCGKRGINVAAGLALDCSGDPVHLPKDQSLEIEKDCDKEPTGPLYVLLCRTEKCCSPRTSMCASDEDEAPSVCTRERDGFEICIVSDLRNKCYCGCKEAGYDRTYHDNPCKCADPTHPCYEDHYAGKCGCHGGEKCDCSCQCILLAQLDKSKTYEKDQSWTIDHRVRRFVRPVLMHDPLAVKPPDDKKDETGTSASAATASAAPASASETPPAQGTVALVTEPAAPAAEAMAAPEAAAEAETKEQTRKSLKAAKPKV